MVSQGYSNIDAAILSVYIHGYASELCLKEESEESMLPSNIIGKFGIIFNSLK